MIAGTQKQDFLRLLLKQRTKEVVLSIELSQIREPSLVNQNVATYIVRMNPSSDSSLSNIEQTTFDRQVVQRLNRALAVNAQSEISELARDIFFQQHTDLEKLIQALLHSRNFSYDEGSSYYNELFDLIYHKIYSPEVLKITLADFNPEKGTLKNWVFGRVRYCILDWFKKQNKGLEINEPEIDRISTNKEELPELDPPTPSAFETSLNQMTDSQRSCTVLFVLSYRTLITEDRTAIHNTSIANGANQPKGLDQLVERYSISLSGIEEKQELAKIYAYQSQLQHLIKVKDFLREQMINGSCNKTELEQLEQQSEQLSAAEIDKKFSSDSTIKRNDRQKQRYMHVCRKLVRYQKLSRDKFQEYFKRKPLKLVKYEEIAEVIASTVAKVTALLNRARGVIKKVIL